MSIGLLIIRVVLGLLLIGHGTQKLFGWFGGPGLRAAASWMDAIGHRPGHVMARMAGGSEALGGLLLLLGLITPLGAAVVIGVMVVASAEHWTNGVWNTSGGYELPLFYAVAALTLGFTGPGRVSVDRAAGLTPWGWGYGLLALAIGLLAALPVLARRQRLVEQPLAAEADPYPTEELDRTRVENRV